MTGQDSGFDLDLSRRKLLAAAGIGGGALLASAIVPGLAAAQAAATTAPVAPTVAGLHLQFGADASS